MKERQKIYTLLGVGYGRFTASGDLFGMVVIQDPKTSRMMALRCPASNKNHILRLRLRRTNEELSTVVEDFMLVGKYTRAKVPCWTLGKQWEYNDEGVLFYAETEASLKKFLKGLDCSALKQNIVCSIAEVDRTDKESICSNECRLTTRFLHDLWYDIKPKKIK